MRKTCENSLHSSLQGPTEGCKRNSVSWILDSKSLSWEVFQFAIAFSNKKQKNNLFFFFFFMYWEIWRRIVPSGQEPSFCTSILTYVFCFHVIICGHEMAVPSSTLHMSSKHKESDKQRVKAMCQQKLDKRFIGSLHSVIYPPGLIDQNLFHMATPSCKESYESYSFASTLPHLGFL